MMTTSPRAAFSPVTIAAPLAPIALVIEHPCVRLAFLVREDFASAVGGTVVHQN